MTLYKLMQKDGTNEVEARAATAEDYLTHGYVAVEGDVAEALNSLSNSCAKALTMILDGSLVLTGEADKDAPFSVALHLVQKLVKDYKMLVSLNTSTENAHKTLHNLASSYEAEIKKLKEELHDARTLISGFVSKPEPGVRETAWKLLDLVMDRVLGKVVS